MYGIFTWIYRVAQKSTKGIEIYQSHKSYGYLNFLQRNDSPCPFFPPKTHREQTWDSLQVDWMELRYGALVEAGGWSRSSGIPNLTSWFKPEKKTAGQS